MKKCPNEGANSTDLRTIFKIQNKDFPNKIKGNPGRHVCVDVSWISPYTSENEVIMDIHGVLTILPGSLFPKCRCKELICAHEIEKCYTKAITIFTNEVRLSHDIAFEIEANFKGLSNLIHKLQKISSLFQGVTGICVHCIVVCMIFRDNKWTKKL